MATSADDHDEHDHEHEHEGHEHDEEHDHEKDEKDEEEAPKKKAAASKPAPAVAKADEDEDEEEDEDEPPPPPKPSKSSARTGKARGPGAGKGRKGSAVAPSGSLGKSVLLFFVIVIGLGAGFAILGREQPAEVARPKWSVGQTVDVEVTLVKSDRQDLGCWSADEVGGKHCAFEAANKAWSKGSVTDDKTLLKPYTTTDRMQFTAAGLWSDPALTPEKLPAARFSVKCKYKVEGTLKSLGVRWEQAGNWYGQENWYAGSISGCTLN